MSTGALTSFCHVDGRTYVVLPCRRAQLCRFSMSTGTFTSLHFNYNSPFPTYFSSRAVVLACRRGHLLAIAAYQLAMSMGRDTFLTTFLTLHQRLLMNTSLHPYHTKAKAATTSTTSRDWAPTRSITFFSYCQKVSRISPNCSTHPPL